MTRVLVVDDEPQIMRALRVILHARSYDVIGATTGRQAVEAAKRDRPDLIVLDLGLPDISGVEVIHTVRGWSTIPILVLSGRLESIEKVRALDAGADDYVTKPFNIEELLARVRAATRRVNAGDDVPVIQAGTRRIDLNEHRVSVIRGDDSREIHLTPTEWRLLEILIRNPGRLVTTRQLIESIRGPVYSDAAHYLRQFMAQLRRKIEDNPSRPRHLLTEPGMGYRFQPDQ
jgi:two-component system KDP operon response regulator KdpE